MVESITENNLKKLAEKLNISPKHGWKKKLAGKLNKNYSSIISDWINEGVPDNFENILTDAGVDQEIWKNIIVGASPLTGQGEKKVNDSASPPLSISSPQKDHTNSILDKVRYVLESNDEKAKAALEFSVEGVFAIVSKQNSIMEEMLNTQKQILSLLQHDSEDKAATGS